jgi:hypothetical protein
MKAIQTFQKMVSDFCDLSTLKWVGVALVIHAIVIGGFSLDYIRECVSPSPVQATPADGKSGAQPTSAPASQMQPKPAADGKGASGKLDEEKILQQRKDTDVVRKLSDTAKPADMPKEPGGLSLDSMDETSKPRK